MVSTRGELLGIQPFITLVTPHIGEIFQVLVQFSPPLTAITANLNAKGVDAVSLSSLV
jgi:hypothetical protein